MRNCLVLVALAWPFACQADDENDYLFEMPPVFSASRLSQSVSEAPSAVSVIDRETIRASGFRQITDIFKLVPGFTVSYLNGNTPVVTYHGMSDQFSRRLQVLIDGRSVYMPPTGGVNWSSLPISIEDIDRIEVVRGPSAASHGSNSFLAVISIITRHPALDGGAKISMTKGSNGIGDEGFRYGGKEGDLDYRVSANYTADDGFAKVNDSKRMSLLNMRGDYKINLDDSLQIETGYAAGPQGVGNPGATGAADPSDPPRNAHVSSEFEQLRWLRSLANGDEISVRFHHNYINETDNYLTLPGILPAPFNNTQFWINNSIRANRYDLELQRTSNLSPQFRHVWGGSLRLDDTVAPLYINGRVQEQLQRGFWHGEWRISEELLANIGAMAEKSSFTGTSLSPQASFNYHFFPNHTLRLGYSEATRSPVIFEQKGNLVYTLGPFVVPRFLGPGNLRPEKIRENDIGYLGEFNDAHTLLDVRLFHNQLSDIVDLIIPQTGGGWPRTFSNIGSATERGMDASLEWRPSTETHLSGNFSHVIIAGQSPYTYNQSAPKNSLSFLASHSFSSGFQASTVYTRQGYARALGSGQPIDGYSRVDIRLAQAFNLYGKRAEVSFVVQNLLNNAYSEFAALNVFDKQAYLKLDVNL